MLTIHHLGLSQSERLAWLCEELAIPYAFKRYARQPGDGRSPPELKGLHPMGTAPLITDGEVAMVETGAIMDYIIHRHGGGRLAVAPASPDYPDYIFWFHFASGTMIPTQIGSNILQYLPDNAWGLSWRERNDRAWAFAEQRLGRSPYFGGPEFTAADIIMFFPMTTGRSFMPRDMTQYPNICEYLPRIGARPAYQRAFAKSEPGMTPVLS
jgi:glutathione S-transferase